MIFRIANILLTAAALTIPSTSVFATENQEDEQSKNQSEIEPTITLTEEEISIPVSEILVDGATKEEIAEIEFIEESNDELAQNIISYAKNFLGRPYRSGGKGPSSFDCSGFTSYIFKNFDIKLSPSSRAQYTQGKSIAKSEIRPGDLMFFGGRAAGKTVGHVGMAVDVDDNGKVTFIHAANRGGIRYDTYPDGGYYSKRFIGARRVIN